MIKPKSLSNVLSIATLIIPLLGVTGCKDLPAPGNYRGNLSFHHLAHLPAVERTPVQALLEYSHTHLTVTVLGAGTQNLLLRPLTISQLNNNTIAVWVPDLTENESHPLVLKKVTNESGECFKSNLPEAESSLCFNPESFTLNIQGPGSELLHLTGTQFKLQGELKFEAPASLTVSQGVDRILNKNYDVQEALQLLLRANETAHQAYLNFIPHTSLGGALSLGHLGDEILEGKTGGTLESVGRPIGDLISFIFPGRWLKAKSITWKAKAEGLAKTLFQINMGTSLQTLSVAFRAHRELRDELQALQDQLTEILKLSKTLAEQHRLDSNAVLTIEIALNDLNLKLWQAQNQFMQDRMILSQTLGFENPEAIEDMIPENETTPLEAVPALGNLELEQEKRNYANLALNHSFELRQLEYLHRAAVLNEKNMYVEWLDTASTLDLGFKLISESKILASLIKSVEIKSDKTRQSLISKAYNLVRDRNILRQTFDIYDVSLKIRKDRLELLIQRFMQFAASQDPAEKLSVQPAELRGSVLDMVAGMSGYYSAKAAVLMDQAELDRMALKGTYEKFLPHLEGGENPPSFAPQGIHP